jgi:hypothetical protein
MVKGITDVEGLSDEAIIALLNERRYWEESVNIADLDAGVVPNKQELIEKCHNDSERVVA